jgi:hypothetical protein
MPIVPVTGNLINEIEVLDTGKEVVVWKKILIMVSSFKKLL